jgi:hypothetical protein
MVRERLAHSSSPDPLDLVEIDLLAWMVAELGRPRQFVVGDHLDIPDANAAVVGGNGLGAPIDRLLFANSSPAHNQILSPARLPSV